MLFSLNFTKINFFGLEYFLIDQILLSIPPTSKNECPINRRENLVVEARRLITIKNDP